MRPLLLRYAELRRRFGSRLGFLALSLTYLGLVLACLASLGGSGQLRLGDPALTGLGQTAGDAARPGFSVLWSSEPAHAGPASPRAGEPGRGAEAAYLAALGAAAWTTFGIATLGSLLGALIALPLALLAARRPGIPHWLGRLFRSLLDVGRAIHSLLFALLLVGLVGAGPGAGILALGLHSAGRYGKSFAAVIERLDSAAVESVRSVGASPLQVFFNAVWPTVVPQFAASHLALWVSNLRDASIVGLVGAGGLGLLIAEAAAASQWGRLAAALCVVVLLVGSFDALGRRLRQALS